MKKSVSLFLLFALPLAASAQVVSLNPVAPVYDGTIEKYRGEFYMMGTGTDGKVLHSRDMVSWTMPDKPSITTEGAKWLDNPPVEFYRGNYARFGAGDIIYRNGVSHIYFNGIGHAYGATPDGKYTTTCTDGPFDTYGIDAQGFQDEDGKFYYIKKVNPVDPDPLTGLERKGAVPEIWAWESPSPWQRGEKGVFLLRGTDGSWDRVDNTNFEGPEMFRYRDNYYILYSPNCMSVRTGLYHIGVARSASPVGFGEGSKYDAPLIFRNNEQQMEQYTQLLHDAHLGGWECDYTFTKPSGDWLAASYTPKPEQWQKGEGGFGAERLDRNVTVRSVRTDWKTPNLWIRREVNIEKIPARMAFRIAADCHFTIWVNGVRALSDSDFADPQGYRLKGGYRMAEVRPSLFREGGNIICVEATAPVAPMRYLDFGLFGDSGDGNGSGGFSKTVTGPSQANYIVGRNGFEQWIVYKAFWNGVSGQGMSRLYFKGLDPVSYTIPQQLTECSTPSKPFFVDYFDKSSPEKWSYADGRWRVTDGILTVARGVGADSGSGSAIVNMKKCENYYFEAWLRFGDKGPDAEAGVYVYYNDPDDWMRIGLERGNGKWVTEVCHSGKTAREEHPLPANFMFLDDDPRVKGFAEPWHVLRFYRNGTDVKVYLDAFRLQPAPLAAGAGASVPGLYSAGAQVDFDAVICNPGWDEYGPATTGWQFAGGWKTGESGIVKTDSSDTPALKGDPLTGYEFIVNATSPHGGRFGFYPAWVDGNNYIKATVDYSDGVMEVVQRRDGRETSRDRYSLEMKPLCFERRGTQYEYDFGCMVRISGADIVWFEGFYNLVKQNYGLPSKTLFEYMDDKGAWQPVEMTSVPATPQFAVINSYGFKSVETRKIRLTTTAPVEAGAENGTKARPFAIWFDTGAQTSYLLRAVRESGRLKIYADGKLVASMAIDMAPSKVGLTATCQGAEFNGITCFAIP